MEPVEKDLKINPETGEGQIQTVTSISGNFVYLRMPAYAMRVKLELTNEYRDPLQQALLGLLSTPATVTTLSSDLGIKQQSIVERALEELSYAGLVETNQKKIFKLSDNYSDEGILERRNGWAIWDVTLNRFLPQLIIDAKYETIIDLHTKNIDTSRLSDQLDENDIPPPSRDPELKKRLLNSIGSDDFCIYSSKNDNITQINDRVVSVSFTESRPAFTYDIVPVEIQTGITSDSELFFFAPMCCVVDEFSNFEYMPRLRDIILGNLPDTWQWLERKAQEINNEYLDSINSEALKELGGEEKLLQVAKQAVLNNLKGVDLKNKFNTIDLQSAAEEAEKFFIFYEKKLTSKVAARRSYEIILQQFASSLGDVMSGLLKNPQIQHSLDGILKQKENDSSPNKKDREKESINKKASNLGIDLGPWTLHSYTYNKKEFKKTIDAINDNSQIHQIGTAFTLWLLPIIIEDDYEEIDQLKSWIKRSFKDLNNLMYIVDATTKQRNIDMKLENTEEGMPIVEIRSNIYRIWQTIGKQH